MVWHLPPLNALRAFEAAGRHKSFTLAADELHVTPGAISRQIKTLEDALGVQVFERGNREVSLTPESQAFLAAVSEGFRRIDHATNGLLEANKQVPLRITTSMLFAMRWLFPRLPTFHMQFPRQNVSITTTLPPIPAQFETDAADILIRLGRSDWPAGVVSHSLFASEHVVICSPELLERGPPLRCVDDLRRHTLLYSELRPDIWPTWLKAAGVSMDLSNAVKLDSSALTLAAALEGLGVALGERTLVADEVAKGRLLTPLDFSYRNGEVFYLIYHRRSERRQGLREFCDWVLGELTADLRMKKE